MIPKHYLKHIRQVEIRTRRLAEDYLSGAYRSTFKGRGLDFEDVRAYAVGDDVRCIDWNVTARMHTPFVREFAEEREISVMLLVDVSGSGEFASAAQTKRELAAETAACLAFSATANGDKVGLLLFSDRVERYVPPGKGRRQALRILSDVLFHAPRERGTNVRHALNFLNKMQSRRAIVFLISDLLDEGFERVLRTTAQRHDLIAVLLADARERELPDAGHLLLEDAETGMLAEVDTGDPLIRAEFSRRIQARRTELRHQLLRQDVAMVELNTGEDIHAPLRAFMEKRQRSASR